MHGGISIVLLAIGSLAAIGKSAATGVWEGHLSFGSGEGNFHPCNSRETWWVRDQGYSRMVSSLYEQYQQIATHPYERVYARVRGRVSKRGQYGRLGSYQRVLYVEEILEVRPREERDCQA